MTVPLLLMIAAQFGIDAGELIESDETRLVDAARTALFAAAQQLGRLAAAVEIDPLLKASDVVVVAPVLVRNALASYFAGALVMPYTLFTNASLNTLADHRFTPGDSERGESFYSIVEHDRGRRDPADERT